MLIAEALAVKERYSGVSWEEMKEDDQAMYQCAVQRLSYLQSIPKKHSLRQKATRLAVKSSSKIASMLLL
ncbi:hypothetical protein ACYAO4_002717 [Cronobacter turicensis]